MSTVAAALGLVAAGAWVLAACCALAVAQRGWLALTCALSGAGGVAALGAGALLLLAEQPRTAVVGGGSVVGGLQLRTSPLAGMFVALLGLVAVAIAWYAPRYHRHANDLGRATALYLSAYNLALLASLAVLTAGGVVTFLVAWESMALLCYLLVLRHARSADTARNAFWYLALSEAGFRVGLPFAATQQAWV